jgi:hypothetical protein
MAAVAMSDQATGPPAPPVLFIRSRAASATWLMRIVVVLPPVGAEEPEHPATPDRQVDPVQCPGLAIDLDQAARLTRDPPGSNDPHHAGTARLEQIIRRGQRAGGFDRTLPAAWLTAAILGLFRTAAEEAAAGRLTTSQAAGMLLDSTLRLCGAAGARC